MNKTNKIKAKLIKAVLKVNAPENQEASARFQVFITEGAKQADTQARQLRIARRLGQPVPETVALWQSLMGLRAQIDKEVFPMLLAQRQAERECFAIQHVTMDRKARIVVSDKVTRPTLQGFEYTPEWWLAAEQRERNLKVNKYA